jgi:hypothetical protein
MMNERIRECWLKAAREDSGEKWDTQEEFIERFAREIIAECSTIVQNAVNHREPASTYVGKIKQHFGVEE